MSEKQNCVPITNDNRNYIGIIIVIPMIVIMYCTTITQKATIMELYALTDNMILEKIGENIKCMRLEHNIIQKELAGSVGVAISSIAALERGESISLKTLVPILSALNSLHMLSGF